MAVDLTVSFILSSNDNNIQKHPYIALFKINKHAAGGIS